MADYINDADVTDNVIKAFTLDPYLAEADKKVISLAQRNGVFDADDIATEDGHAKNSEVLRYAVVFVCMRVCQDYMGTNNNDLPVEIEKYAVKYKSYNEELKLLDGTITKEMITDEVDETADRSTAYRLYRA